MFCSPQHLEGKISQEKSFEWLSGGKSEPGVRGGGMGDSILQCLAAPRVGHWLEDDV